jgi:hypothetical protein
MRRAFDRSRGLTPAAHSTKDPVVAAAQMVRLEILASTYEGQPEESTMILSRLEIACLQAGRPDDAAAAHERALVYAGRCGFAAKERWERSPRWFRALTRRFRPAVELFWENGRYRRMAAVLDHQLADVDRRSPRRAVSA